jgi:Tol biopolymer transport system component
MVRQRRKHVLLRGSRSRRRLVLAVVGASCLAVTVVTGVGPAQASYPGVNGRLAFGLIGENVDIYTIKPDGDALRRLTTDPGLDICPAYSPDGKSIAFCRFAGGGAEIWVMKANGQQQHQVTHLGGRAAFPDYSPDGARLAFGGVPPGQATPDIFTADTDGAGLVRLTTDPGSDGLPAWSPDGSQIVFQSNRTGTFQVWIMNADGTDQHPLTSDPADKGQVPDWSPDGTKIVYQSNATGGGDIYVMNRDGTNQTRLTGDPAFEFGPAWSPDGTQIAFQRDPAGLFVMNADGSGQHLVHAGAGAVVAWQPLLPDESD